MTGQQKVECRLTLRTGEVLWDDEGLSCQAWEDAGDYKVLK